jgi:hypothetical protein
MKQQVVKLPGKQTDVLFLLGSPVLAHLHQHAGSQKQANEFGGSFPGEIGHVSPDV